jgi:hypothetical protein
LKVWGVKLRESEVQWGISKRVVVQGGLVKFPLFFNFNFNFFNFLCVCVFWFERLYIYTSFPLTSYFSLSLSLSLSLSPTIFLSPLGRCAIDQHHQLASSQLETVVYFSSSLQEKWSLATKCLVMTPMSPLMTDR